ncbi:Tim44-like domain-containing protein [Craterilacuibacter sp. RT1T]|uniref:Tim44 domain-containing protein n=1 Tax=Craterilacuibacter sp. RT1T TaxID=2942211 RepID=UPI0020BF813D|nr:Tim44-like domain-containing protein [Craterilacuibacter sp. RT1T]MCL6264547.1 Tim44-like domain-containing protein [Craterilacuibacter sp. RT1T]
MSSYAKTLVLALSMASMLAAPFAEAAKLGKSKSFGMKRSAPTQSYQQPARAPVQPMAPAQQQPRKGPGVGTAIAAGAAGAAAGYMLGSAMSGGEASGGASETAGSGMPWGTLAMLGLLFAGGMMLFRRRMANQAAPAMRTPQMAGMPPQSMAPAAQPARFDGIPSIGSGLQGGAAGAMAGSYGQQRLPDGTEVPAFLRQAKATFLHLQSLNSPDNVDEISKYMTPDLFAAMREDILSNSGMADFPQLECSVIDAVTEGGRYIASVRFSGTVSEDVNAATVPFAETWHYVKDSDSPRWLLAGIQQD